MSRIDRLIRAARRDKEENNHSLHISKLVPFAKRGVLSVMEPRTFYCIYILNFLEEL